MSASCKFPMTVALAEKFLWEVFLTEKWDHLFLGDENTGLPILPRQLSFCPTKRSWGIDQKSDICSIVYLEPGIGSRVTVEMRRERADEAPGLLWPSSIAFDVTILSRQFVASLGLEKLITSKIEVWRK